MSDVPSDVKVPKTIPEALPDPSQDLIARVATLQNQVASLEKSLAYVPPQIRMLGAKVDGLTTAISEPRFKALLLGLLGIYDLVDQILRTLPAQMTDSDRGQTRNYQVLHAQLRALLEANGLSEIPAGGMFDPLIHRALQSTPVGDPQKDGHVLEVVRPGFRTEQAVLRYAEVLVGRYLPPAPAPGEAEGCVEGRAETSGDAG